MRCENIAGREAALHVGSNGDLVSTQVMGRCWGSHVDKGADPATFIIS